MKDDHQLKLLHDAILGAVSETSLRDEVTRLGSAVSGGKMIRGRLVITTGEASGLAVETAAALGAAVELLHAGSLLHDDIVDAGTERRGSPALWVSDSVKSAVVVGDLLLSVSMRLMQRHGSPLMPILVRTLSDMCDAQAEQEFSSGSNHSGWDTCLRIARRKTGALFGLAAACGAGDNAELAAALDSAGRDLGTAYQLADDLLDIAPASHASGKSLGTDAASGKLTAALFANHPEIDSLAEIEKLLSSAAERLAQWPKVHDSWNRYVNSIIRPIIDHFTNHTVS